MIEINLSNNPSQSFSIQLDMHQYDFVIKSINPNNIDGTGIMAVSIARDGVQILQNSRAAPVSSLIPYQYLEEGQGNFFFITLRDEYPNYMQFGITQSLLYLTNSELGALRDQ
jgi:hypothetical protein